MLHLDAQWLSALKKEFTIEEQTTVRLIQKLDVYAHFCRLNAVLFSTVDVHEKEAALIEFMGDWGSKTSESIAEPEPSVSAPHKLQPALKFLQQNSVGMCSLAELAQMVSMSRYQLIRAFRASTGMTPHAYQQNIRINQARAGLRSGEEIADMAYRLGFADQSHFQRVFKAYSGVTPGCYRMR